MPTQLKKPIHTALDDVPEDVDKLLRKMREIEKDSMADRSKFFTQIKLSYAYYSKNKPEIFTGKGKKGQSARHIPILWQYVTNLVAILTSQEIVPKYVPKLNQGDNSIAEAERANAQFEMYRDIMRWDETIDVSFLIMLMASGCVMGPYLDKLNRWPERVVGMRTFNPWQYHQTRGSGFNDAPEKLLTYYMDSSQLLGVYPQFADTIKKLEPVDRREEGGEGRQGDTSLSFFEDMPKQQGMPVVVSRNAIKVTEFWQFDPSVHRNNKEEDFKKAMKENETFMDAIQGSMDLPDIRGLIEPGEYDRQHIQRHQDGIGIISQTPVAEHFQEQAGRVLGALADHIKDHESRVARTAPEDEGYIYKYERGWRYTVVLNEVLVVEDSENPYLDYGLIKPPLTELALERDPFHPRATPFAYQLIDLAGGINNAFNMTEDILKSMLPKFLYKKGTIGADKLTSAPDEPIEVDTPGGLGDSIMNLPQPTPSPAVFAYLNEMKEGIEGGAGIYAPLRGQPGKNVRSAKQLESNQAANLILTDSRIIRIKPYIKKIATEAAMMFRKLPPPDEIMAPVLDGITQFVTDEQWIAIANLPFAIDIVLRKGSIRISDERKQGVIQLGMALAPLFQGIPTAGPIIARGISEAFKEDLPGLAKMAQELEQAVQKHMQMMAQMSANESGLPSEGGESPT